MTSFNDLADLITPWSIVPTKEETLYRKQGYVRTVGTHFQNPPKEQELIAAFEKSHLGTELSAGARALCKHYARIDHHPYWVKPVGSPKNKSELAKRMLYLILDNAIWKNIHRLPNQKLVLEIRNDSGYGMRWNLDPELIFVGYLEAMIIPKK